MPKIAVATIQDGKSLRVFVLNGDYRDSLKMVWESDARRLNYVAANGSQRALWQQSLDGAAPRVIANLGNDDIEDLALSPDGRTYAFTRGKWIHDAILIDGLK